ncbi:MAG: 50S ribosomal protein L35 [Candidatus Omnitrophica bacterium]|nr:50S ribosomal protein L35 [Candidatus Omnitrophota bacterium]
MPKVKTKKGLAKRVTVTKKKKVLRSKAGRRHLLSSKTRKQKRDLGKKDTVSNQKKLLKKGLPYEM